MWLPAPPPRCLRNRMRGASVLMMRRSGTKWCQVGSRTTRPALSTARRRTGHPPVDRIGPQTPARSLRPQRFRTLPSDPHRHAHRQSRTCARPTQATGRVRPTSFPTLGDVRQVFTGEYRHSVDDKGRIAVPARFRLQLDGGAVLVSLDRRLPGDLHPKADCDALAARSAASASPTRRRGASARRCSPAPTRSSSTGQGRVVVPGLVPRAGRAGRRRGRRRRPRPRRDLGAGRLGRLPQGDGGPDALAEHLTGLGI